jgi:hypothetical protein
VKAMNKNIALISGIGIGAGLMYLLDPDKGNRRRAIARDKMVHSLHKTRDAVGTTSRDMQNRARGLVSAVGSRFSREDVPDDILVERVRSKMGRVISHPSSINVTARLGRVTLRGSVLSSEVKSLLKNVSSVRGVQGIDNQLEVHNEAGKIPELQGESRRPGARFELFQENWSPTARLLVGLAGGAIATYGASRRSLMGLALSSTGLCMITRSATNKDIKEVVHLGGAGSEGKSDISTATDSASDKTGDRQRKARQGYDG